MNTKSNQIELIYLKLFRIRTEICCLKSVRTHNKAYNRLHRWIKCEHELSRKHFSKIENGHSLKEKKRFFFFKLLLYLIYGMHVSTLFRLDNCVVFVFSVDCLFIYIRMWGCNTNHLQIAYALFYTHHFHSIRLLTVECSLFFCISIITADFVVQCVNLFLLFKHASVEHPPFVAAPNNNRLSLSLSLLCTTIASNGNQLSVMQIYWQNNSPTTISTHIALYPRKISIR